MDVRIMGLLKEIYSFILSIDLRELLYAVVGAFLGFGSALVLEKKSAKKAEKETIQSSLKNLLLELQDILDTIVSATEDKQIIIDIPIYEAAVQSGNILVFVDKSYYVSLLRTYSSIKYLASRETNDNTANPQQLQQVREDVINKIKSLIKEINWNSKQK